MKLEGGRVEEGQVGGARRNKRREESDIILSQPKIYLESKQIPYISTDQHSTVRNRFLCDILYHSSLWLNIGVQVCKSHRMMIRTCLPLVYHMWVHRSSICNWIVTVDLQASGLELKPLSAPSLGSCVCNHLSSWRLHLLCQLQCFMLI